MSEPVIPLARAKHPRFGGKVTGLARLLEAGLTVPDGLVVTDRAAAQAPEIFATLAAPALAVRSSATCEDGADASAAGQFETFLAVDSVAALQRAIAECFASLHSERAARYLENVGGTGNEEAAMSVLVQPMVAGAVAGVLFTVDPTAPAPGTILVEAVPGPGEGLVSGHVEAEQIRIDRDSLAITGAGGLLSEETARELARQALVAEAFFDRALDLEWVIDRDGQLFWLQARAITTLDLPQPDEFDYTPRQADQFFTRANIGEMLPGAATPLTLELFGTALDGAMRSLYQAIGALTDEDRDEAFVCSFRNHLFFNLDLLYTVPGRVAGTSPESLEVSLLGRELDERPAIPVSNPLVRLFNFFRYAHYVFTHGRAMAELDRILATAAGLEGETASELYGAIDGYRPVLNRTTTLHMQVSGLSGALNGALQDILARGGLDRDQQVAAISQLLSRITGVESAAVIESLSHLADRLRAARQQNLYDPQGSTAALHDWLRSRDSGETGELFTQLLQRHGHRSVREIELREKPWSDDPLALVSTLSLMAAQPAPPRAKPAAPVADRLRDVLREHPSLSSGALGWVTRRAREAVRKREYTKSILIKISARLRGAYRALAALLVADGTLPDEDLIYFFTHEELGDVCARSATPDLLKRAQHRRRHLPQQMALRFPDFCRGAPQPIRAEQRRGRDGDVIRGMAVSPGVATGVVRVIRSLADTQELRPGEIMVTGFTDIGWTPYYGVAAGLITEIGSSLSHGAVVAREYGLPMITAVTGVTERLQSGDRVEMNGGSGEIDLLSRPPGDEGHEGNSR